MVRLKHENVTITRPMLGPQPAEVLFLNLTDVGLSVCGSVHQNDQICIK